MPPPPSRSCSSTTAPDALLFEQALRGVRARDRAFRIAHVATVSHATARLTAHACDVVVLDLALPDSDGISCFAALTPAAGEVPIVVLSCLADEHVAIDAVRRGAQDYLVRGQDDGPALAAALAGAIDRK